MNEPQVVALIYTVKPTKAGRYDNATPLRHSDEPEFDLTVEDKIARFEFKKFYRTVHEAREAIEPFMQSWVFPVAMREESDGFTLEYKEAEIIDRNPLPPGPRPAPKQLKATTVFMGALSVIAELTVVSPDYPPPPAGGSVDLDDPVVVKMKTRYEQYRLGEAKLPEVAYFCVDALEKKYGGRSAAAQACGISSSILKEIKKLSSNKGGKDSRKDEGFGADLTREEKRFLDRALKEVIIRVAQVAADGSQRQPQITMADLPRL